MNRFISSLIICVLSLLFFQPLIAQKKSSKKNKKITLQKYVDSYKSLAIIEMQRTNVPASITLAQGILESRYGNSHLARKGRNHFGIKCHKGWKSKKMMFYNGKRKSCYRKYKSVYASFIDHSNFLVNNPRYKDLFILDGSDYASWAEGLRAAGYAADPSYPSKLISIIDKYKLHTYDEHDAESYLPAGECEQKVLAITITYNRLKAVVFDCPIVPTRVEAAFDISQEKLLKYNNLTLQDTIPPNKVIYLQAPKKKGPSGIYQHIVLPNETMESIAFLYGMRLDALYKRNDMAMDTQPKEGEILWLR